MPVDIEPASTAVDRALTPTGRPSVPAPPAPPAPPAARLFAWLESRALFVTAVAVVIVLCLAGIPSHVTQDTWLALVAGRIIAAHGIPQHDYLTVMAHGVRWIDQQWLAQIAMLGVERLGGLQLLTVGYVFLTGFAFALAVAAARRLGGRDVHVLAMLPLGTFFYLATAVSIRTQGIAYPLFVATLWLLAAQARRPTGRRAFLVFPMLVLWSNLHGSVTLGVALAVIYGGTLIARAVQADGLRGLLRARAGFAFVLGAPLTLFATPYGLSIVTYYRHTLFNPGFGKLVSEWQPITAYTILAVPLLLLVLGTIWALGRSGRRTPAFDQIALAVLALGAIFAVRNITWFGLAVLMMLPATLSELRAAKPSHERRATLNVTLAGSSLALVLLTAVVTLARPASWFTSNYPQRALGVIAHVVAARPATKIFADVRYADWLVWRDPALAGHIAYDTSLENLTDAQLSAINTISAQPGPGAPNTLAPYSVLMLSPVASNRASNRILLARPGTHVILRSRKVVIATKPATPTG